MERGWQCLVLMRTRECLHGSVFPDGVSEPPPAQLLLPGLELMRIVTYPIGRIEHLMSALGKRGGKSRGFGSRAMRGSARGPTTNPAERPTNNSDYATASGGSQMEWRSICSQMYHVACAGARRRWYGGKPRTVGGYATAWWPRASTFV